MRKTFILDTSVLLYDKTSIHSFPENDVVLPIVSLDELDRFKSKKGIIGENARYVNRYLDDLRKEGGSIHEGVELENGQTIRVALEGYSDIPNGLNGDDADNKMIALAKKMTLESDKSVVMITKDINFRVKCDAVGVKSEDYYKDQIIDDNDKSYKGFVELDLGQDLSHLIDMLYNEEDDLTQDIEDLIGRKTFPNEFICLKSGSQSILAQNKRGIIKKMEKLSLEDFMGIKARNREQSFALNLLLDDNVPLVSLTGIAGSGKTFLTLMAGIEGINKGKYKRIVITRNIQPVGRDIGFLPGDADDKMLPWIAPIMDNFRQGMKDKDLSYFEAMRRTGQIEIAPLAFMRGRTFSETFLIIDESQNSSIHELKTVITRIGEDSKVILLGDTDQVDTPYIDSLSNGLTIVSEKFKDQEMAGHIQLQKGERSKLSFLASKIL